MTPNTFNVSLLAVILSLTVAGRAEAQSSPGVRANGMAGAFVGVADDASAVYWNPAGLATGPIVAAAGEIGGFKGGDAGATPAIRPVLAAFTLPPVGIAYYREGSYALGAPEAGVAGVRSREEVRRSVHTLSTDTVALSLLQSVNEHIVVSATPKVVRGGGATRVDVDLAAMLAVQHVRVGVMARSLTSPSFELDEAGGGSVEVPRQVRIGGGWGSGWPGHSRVVVAIDGDVLARVTPAGDRRDVAAGVETWWRARRVGVRGGVRGSTLGESRTVVTGGASFAVSPGFYLDGHVARGQAGERSWSVGARYVF